MTLCRLGGFGGSYGSFRRADLGYGESSISEGSWRIHCGWSLRERRVTADCRLWRGVSQWGRVGWRWLRADCRLWRGVSQWGYGGCRLVGAIGWTLVVASREVHVAGRQPKAASRQLQTASCKLQAASRQPPAASRRPPAASRRPPAECSQTFVTNAATRRSALRGAQDLRALPVRPLLRRNPRQRRR